MSDRLTDGRIELTVLGQTLMVRSAESPDYLRKLAKLVEDRAVALQRGGVRDPMSALALAAIELADELHRARDETSRDAKDVGARLGALVELLESVNPRE